MGLKRRGGSVDFALGSALVKIRSLIAAALRPAASRCLFSGRGGVLAVMLLTAGSAIPSLALGQEGGAQGATVESDLGEAYRALVAAIQGPSVEVAGTPALCAARAKERSETALVDAQVAEAFPYRAPDFALQQKYFSTNACRLEASPPEGPLITRASAGFRVAALDPARIEALTRGINDLSQSVSLDPVPPEAGLLVQSLGWELAAGTLSQTTTWSSQSKSGLRELGCGALSLAESVNSGRLSDREAQVATSYERLRSAAEAAGEPLIAELAEALGKGVAPADVVEATPVSTSHLEALHGRFTARLFLMGSDQESRASVAQFLLGDRAVFARLGRLPMTHADLRAILLLEINELKDGVPRSSGVVAFWQEVRFEGKLSLFEPKLSQAEERVEFRTVRGEVGLDLELHYTMAAQDSLAHKSFIDMFPRAGAPATTLRGNCLLCHTRTLHNFNPQVKRAVRLAPVRNQEELEREQPGLVRQFAATWNGWKQKCEALVQDEL